MDKFTDKVVVSFKTNGAVKAALRGMAEKDGRSLIGQLEWLIVEELRRRQQAEAMPTREELDAQQAVNADLEEQLRSRFRPVARNISI